MRLSYKVEIQPTPSQLASLRQHAGNARWAYNWGLARRKDAYAAWVDAGKPKDWAWSNAISLHKALNALKKVSLDEGGVPWMYDASKCAPQEALRDLDKAFKSFFRRLRQGKAKLGFPRFKSKIRSKTSFRLSNGIKASAGSIKLPRLGRLRLKPGERGYIPQGAYATATVSERAGRWYVSVLGAERSELPIEGPAVGLDLGVARLATLSDGTVIENPRALRSATQKLSRAGKALARKKKGSNNRGKARAIIAKVHARIANIRANSLHQATTYLAKNHGLIVIEDLKVVNMMAGGGSRKRGLNRVLADASFGEFRRQLEYKGKLYGCEIIAVPAAYTSQRCSECGYTEKGNRLSQSAFCCLDCGHEENADLNAAKNILAAGSCPDAQNACGETVRPNSPRRSRHVLMKQESTCLSTSDHV